MGVENNALYIRESSKPIICLSDNIAVVNAAKKIEKGLFSASPRLQTLVTATQRYKPEFKHISGKLPTSLIAVADHCSRNPVDCTTKGCKVCDLSKDPDTSFSTIRQVQTSNLLDVKSSKSTWLEIQESSDELRMAAVHIKAGTKPSKKNNSVGRVKKLVSIGTINHQGLLIVKKDLPMELNQAELIVVPSEFALSVMTLLHNDTHLNHPNPHQMKLLVRRKFFFFNIGKLTETVFNNCLQCTARKKLSQEIVKLETQTKQSKPGEFCNADVLLRDKRKILVVRDNLTSFTQTKFIDSEKKEDLRSGLASLINPIKSNTVTTVRVDPHSTFKALKEDKLLKQINITLEIGHEKNLNKNTVAEKAIQE